MLVVILALAAPAAHAGKSETINDSISLELNSKGKGPKTELRYQMAPDTEWDVDTTTGITVKTVAGGQEQTPILPDSTLTHHYAVTGVADGSVEYTLTATDAKVQRAEGVDEAMAGAMEAELRKEVGKAQAGTVSDRGVSAADGANADSAIIFPLDPIAVGASWTVHVEKEENGLSLRQSTTYDVLSWEGSAVSLRATVGVTPLSDEANLPSLPPGASAKLTKLEATGGGSVNIDLTRFGKTESNIVVDMVMNLAIEMAGQEVPLTSEIHTEVNTK